uniref:Predicted nuclease of the RNAse H fold, HicB family n=1 Tax=Candidatus Kentrum sp. FM TaxID=2126340 RepID=A0A450SJ56_9GAMM|nr:MAG: Predicted nuclease of the RNAse H fold, HicB family [Candidatus Kentron sp. FM]VFJ54632.1 MAG: Predicted nuclease of the RNAse H fold, HicB family [Candidatus Kentron sp. FM]VFK10382.1 MAG: Predicted nuclease of the RNAse H fold, HicB family [Candidatus Kentron sp. FM]
MNIMTYKGYAASIEYSDDDECFIGHIAGIKDRVGFHGESVAELKEAFHEATEDYLDTCATVGKEPQKPYSGRLMLHIPPELHATIAIAAQVSGQSINQWVSGALNQASRIY